MPAERVVASGCYVVPDSDATESGEPESIAALKAELAAARAENGRLRQAIYESHHRVKNHLQTLASLLDVQLMEEAESVPAAEVRRIVQQIQALSVVHDLLTASTKVAPTATVVPIHTLLARLFSMYNQSDARAPYNYALSELALPVVQASALALVANELAANAIKHGGTRAELHLKVHGGSAELRVIDDGPGFPAGFDFEAGAHTGLDIVGALVRTDLRGTLRVEQAPGGGACAVVTFPCRNP